MNRKISFATAVLTLIILTSTAQNNKPQNNEPLNIKRYMGTWFEIARYDHKFERNLQNVTATYKLLPNGNVQVINQGNTGTVDGPTKTAIGKAKVKSLENKHLMVSFFWIFYSDYKILELAQDYSYALIGSKSPNYFWILSRTPELSKSTQEYLLKRTESLGYDTKKLIWVEHKKTE